MISTCVHCKKEFEWEKITPFVGCEYSVQCCHCKGCIGINADGVGRPLIQSRPLQVAKKFWVVKIDRRPGLGYLDVEGMNFITDKWNVNRVAKFVSQKEAAKAAAKHIETYRNIYIAIEFLEVDV